MAEPSKRSEDDNNINGEHSNNKNSWKYLSAEDAASSKHLSAEDAALVTDFLPSHPNVRLRVSSDAEGTIAYTYLAELLRLVKRHTVLELLDFRRSLTLELLHQLRRFSCDGGSWLDSLQHSLSANSHVDSRSLQEFMIMELFLTEKIDLEGVEAVLDKIREDKKRLLEARDALKVTHTF